MTALQIAKSRSDARTEAHVAFRGAVANAEWDGLAITVSGANLNGGTWGCIEQPRSYFATLTALAGGSASVGVNLSTLTDFNQFAPAFFANNGKVRVYRIVNGNLSLVRAANVVSCAADYWSFISGPNIITGNTFEYQIPSAANQNATYTFGVARIDSNGNIGPVATVSQAVGGARTVLTPAVATTGAAREDTEGRNASLPAVTGLTAQIRTDTTHNIQLSWDAGAPDEFVVFINWSGSSDRLNFEGEIILENGPEILAGDLLIYESDPVLTIDPDWISNRIKNANNAVRRHAPTSAILENQTNEPGGRTWEYVPYDASNPKPDNTYPDYFLRLKGTPSLPAQAGRFFHGSTNQDFRDVLVPGRIYRAEFVASASQSMSAVFNVASATVSGSSSVALTTSRQTVAFDFTVSSIASSGANLSWTLTGDANNVDIDIYSVRVWDTTKPYLRLSLEPPQGIDIRDHNLIKRFPPPSFNSITSRNGSVLEGGALDCLLDNCKTYNCSPHFQFEWIYDDDFYYDLVTFLYAPASSNEPLALKREAMGYGPVNVEFARHLYEDGNERWNSIMWAMFGSATDSVTAEQYSQGDVAAMFAKRRRTIMESNPYWPAVNPPIEFVGGWLRNTGFTVDSAAGFPEANYTSVANYTSGWDVNRVLVSDAANRFSEVLAAGQIDHKPALETIKAAAPAGLKLAIYEAGPGYQLDGLNGAVVTVANRIEQECFAKSIAGTTATMSSVAIGASIGYGPYNFFTWGPGPLWSAGRRPHEMEGHSQPLYRVANFLKQTYELLGRSRVYATNKFIDRTRDFQNIDTNGNPTTVTQVERAAIYHFESLDYPGRHGILYVNTTVNRDAFGVGHPDYVEGETGAADFRYHTGLPASATPYKVLRNEGNMRHHDAYKVGFRPNVVGSAIDGYVADPLCVDLTVTPEDFTVSDPTLRELTLLGGNCRLEVFTV